MQDAVFGKRAAGDADPSQESGGRSARVLNGGGRFTDRGAGPVEESDAGLRKGYAAGTAGKEVGAERLF